MIGDWKDFQREAFDFSPTDLTVVPSESDQVWYIYNNNTRELSL
jgi:hypothetical protein